MHTLRRRAATTAAIVTATVGLLAASGIMAASASAATTFIGGLSQTKELSTTVPGNGDQNPYGVAVVPRSVGDLHQGDVLVSNFNNATTTNPPGGNVQGTGTTIVQISPGGAMTQFAGITDPACPGGVGLTTALVVLRSGWVIVGSLPTQGGTISGSGCLIVLDSHGTVRETITGHGINGPWDMTALDLGGITELFVTNVLNGIIGPNGIVSSSANEGTVLRLLITSGPGAPPQVLAHTQIGSGFAEALNQAALIIGPTGVGLGPDGTLYVADTINSTIDAIPNAVVRFSDDGTGSMVSAGHHLNGELGLAIAPNGDVLTVNGGDGNIVEVNPHNGAQAFFQLIADGGGDRFGLAVKPDAHAFYFVNAADTPHDRFF
jgi:hypothetical protein